MLKESIRVLLGSHVQKEDGANSRRKLYGKANFRAFRNRLSEHSNADIDSVMQSKVIRTITVRINDIVIDVLRIVNQEVRFRWLLCRQGSMTARVKEHEGESDEV